MKNRLIVGIVFVIIAIVIISEIIFIKTGKEGLCQKINAKSDPISCNTFYQGEEYPCWVVNRNECHLNSAFSLNKTSICENIGFEKMKYNCYLWVGINLKDSSTCTKIANITTRDDCYWHYVIETKDISVCDKIKGTSIISKELCKDSIIIGGSIEQGVMGAV